MSLLCHFFGHRLGELKVEIAPECDLFVKRCRRCGNILQAETLYVGSGSPPSFIIDGKKIRRVDL